MVCLDCGKAQSGTEPGNCPFCGVEFVTAPGIHGINHVSQLLQAIEAYKEGQLPLSTVRARFCAFEERWESFAEQWDIADQTIQDTLLLSDAQSTVYGRLLEQLEESLEHLNNALDLLETLNSPQPDKLEQLEDEVRSFWRGSCSALAGLFQKLDTRKGDVDSLLSAFFSSN